MTVVSTVDCVVYFHPISQGPREDQKSWGSETSNLPKIYPSNPKKKLFIAFSYYNFKKSAGSADPADPVLARSLPETEYSVVHYLLGHTLLFSVGTFLT